MPHVVRDDDIRTDGDRRCENVAIGLVVGHGLCQRVVLSHVRLRESFHHLRDEMPGLLPGTPLILDEVAMDLLDDLHAPPHFVEVAFRAAQQQIARRQG